MSPIPNEVVVSWVRNADARLEHVTNEEVRPLIESIRLFQRMTFGGQQALDDNIRDYAKAYYEASAAATRLDQALARLEVIRSAYDQDGNPITEYRGKLRAMGLFSFKPPKRGRPIINWWFTLYRCGEVVEAVMQAAGIRSKLTSKAGPAAAVMSQVVLFLNGEVVSPEMVAEACRPENLKRYPLNKAEN